jgi:hypothetical protein
VFCELVLRKGEIKRHTIGVNPLVSGRSGCVGWAVMTEQQIISGRSDNIAVRSKRELLHYLCVVVIKKIEKCIQNK